MRFGGEITRRQGLSVGASAFGLTLPQLLRAESRTSPSTTKRPRAKSVIVLYLNGGPSQLDMWDMKPNAPEEIRGTFEPISTTVPGIQICEFLPRTAKLAHQLTIVRSMSHNESDHLRAGHWIMTGGRLTRPITAFSRLSRDDSPHMGAVVARELPSPGMLPFVILPEYVSPRGVPRPGQHAGFLGARYDPYTIESDPNLSGYDPGPIIVSDHVSTERLRARRRLIDQLGIRSTVANDAFGKDLETFRTTAFDLVSSPAVRKAFDITAESDQTRERYGRHTFGQSTLAARRLIEAGVRLVQVNFVRHDGSNGGQGYDSHSVPPSPPHLKWAKDELLPPTDAAFAALIEDLDDRGLLDETVVVMMGEFGRTPRLNRYGGRDHWPGCYSLVLAGGGVTSGAVYGRSDSIAATPIADPVSPNDVLATIYHQLGIDHRRAIYDRQGRPHVIADGEPIHGILV